MKQCTGCGETKPLNDFPLAGRGSEKRRSRCKRCFSIRRGKGQLGRKFEMRELLAQGLRRCAECSEVKPLAEFSKWSRSPTGVRGRCKVCTSAAQGSEGRIIENRRLAEQQLRRCSRCEEVKPFSEYKRTHRDRDTVSSRCKQCIREVDGREERAHSELLIANRALVDREVKHCLICRELKPYSDFYKYKSGIGGKHPWCKLCIGRKARMTKYGLTFEEVLAAESLTHCEVCLSEFGPGSELHFDHDHETGKFRGVLCERCNVALGMLQNSPDNLRRMLNYIVRASDGPS